MMCVPIIAMPSDVDFLVFLQPAQSVSVDMLIEVGLLLYLNLMT